MAPDARPPNDSGKTPTPQPSTRSAPPASPATPTRPSTHPTLPPLPLIPSIPAKGTIPCIAKACSACCHDIEMLLTEADLGRLTALRPEGGFWFEADDGYLQLKTRDGPPANGGQGRPCTFLQADGLCGVHDARPEGCRLFPAVWDEGLRRAVLDEDYCPHTDGFLLPTGTNDAVRRLAERLEQERAARRRSTPSRPS